LERGLPDFLGTGFGFFEGSGLSRQRESERGLDRNLESGSLGFLPGPGRAALEIQERIADHLPGAGMEIEDYRGHTPAMSRI
jgi:hypothetical protein